MHPIYEIVNYLKNNHIEGGKTVIEKNTQAGIERLTL